MAHAAVLLTASHETSANTIAWTLFLLATHPEIYAAIEDEIAGVLVDKLPSPDDIASLRLLDRVVKESQRLLPASCILFFRRAEAPFTIDGRAMPAGTRLVVSPFIAHRTTATYDDPNRFVPSRWETINPSVYEYMPFGAGPRLCIGAQFAAQAVRIALAVILSRFRVETTPDLRVDRFVRGITLGAKDGVKLRLRERRGPFAKPHRITGDIHDIVEALPR